MKRSGLAGPLVAPYAYIAALLPFETLTENPASWRAPTAAEIRIVIGKNSETGISGAEAANLVGVLPQNFRKYTAADDAASWQKMSFSMWHLLLHRTGVKLATIEEIRPKA
jgi:hypothetical protein